MNRLMIVMLAAIVVGSCSSGEDEFAPGDKTRDEATAIAIAQKACSQGA